MHVLGITLAAESQNRRAFFLYCLTGLLALLSILVACGGGAADSRSSAQSIHCPAATSPVAGWKSVTTSDGKMTLTIPPDFQPVESGNIWANQSGSIGYTQKAGKDSLEANRSAWCTEDIGGIQARFRIYRAQAAFGEGTYGQAVFAVPGQDDLQLIGFSRDSGGGTLIVAMLRSARVVRH
jgi:hypothetical protein